MSGQSEKIVDKRIMKNDDSIWPALLSLVALHYDDFPFSAKELMRKAGKASSGASITRDRGGITKWFLDNKNKFIDDLQGLVDREMQNTGDISMRFCRDLGYLIVSFKGVIACDIISHSHRNIENLLDYVKPLIKESQLLFFGAELYQLLASWYHDNSFARESVMFKYDQKIRMLFLTYQIIRPDMGVTHSLSTSPENRKDINEHARSKYE